MRNLEGPNFDKCECGHTRFVHVVKHGDVHDLGRTVSAINNRRKVIRKKVSA